MSAPVNNITNSTTNATSWLTMPSLTAITNTSVYASCANYTGKAISWVSSFQRPTLNDGAALVHQAVDKVGRVPVVVGGGVLMSAGAALGLWQSKMAYNEWKRANIEDYSRWRFTKHIIGATFGFGVAAAGAYVCATAGNNALASEQAQAQAAADAAITLQQTQDAAAKAAEEAAKQVAAKAAEEAAAKAAEEAAKQAAAKAAEEAAKQVAAKATEEAAAKAAEEAAKQAAAKAAEEAAKQAAAKAAEQAAQLAAKKAQEAAAKQTALASQNVKTILMPAPSSVPNSMQKILGDSVNATCNTTNATVGKA